MDDQLILEISQVNSYIKEMMDHDLLLTGLCVRGEISNYKKYPSGHHYFTLKDGEASLKCVMFRSNAQRMRFQPENGMTVLASGRITVYPRDGAYQLYCIAMTPEGAGSMAIAFEQLKKKLAAEGLFDEEKKKPIPKYPHRIALVTSSAGAALQDVLRILRRRYPLAEVVLLSVRVQGSEAAAEISSAIDYANDYHIADLIITGRGGGSAEDLWAFNEEIVARAIYRSAIPVISAVGHEPDVTISDYVADLRAATPSNAAELAVPDREELYITLRSYDVRMQQSLSRRLKLARQQLELKQSAGVFRFPKQQLDERNQQLDYLMLRMSQFMGQLVNKQQLTLKQQQTQLNAAMQVFLNSQRIQLDRVIARIDAMSPLKVLARGYSITETREGAAVRNASDVEQGDHINIRLFKGSISAIVTSCMEE